MRSAGSVYLYFKSKSKIIAAVVGMTLGTADELLAGLLADDATPSPETTVAFIVDPDTDPEHIGAVLLGIVHAFALQRLLIPGTDSTQYLPGVRAPLAATRG